VFSGPETLKYWSISKVVKPELFVKVVSTYSNVGGLDCWSPIIITLAP
jgi:hypothetical protein